MFVIRVYQGGRERLSRTFDQDRVSVGSSPVNDLVLAGEGVAKRHARIERDGFECTVVALQTHYGIRVNETRWVRSPPLLPGDDIAIGDHVLRVELMEATQATAVARAPTPLVKLDWPYHETAIEEPTEHDLAPPAIDSASSTHDLISLDSIERVRPLTLSDVVTSGGQDTMGAGAAPVESRQLRDRIAAALRGEQPLRQAELEAVAAYWIALYDDTQQAALAPRSALCALTCCFCGRRGDLTGEVAAGLCIDADLPTLDSGDNQRAQQIMVKPEFIAVDEAAINRLPAAAIAICGVCVVEAQRVVALPAQRKPVAYAERLVEIEQALRQQPDGAPGPWIDQQLEALRRVIASLRTLQVRQGGRCDLHGTIARESAVVEGRGGALCEQCLNEARGRLVAKRWKG